MFDLEHDISSRVSPQQLKEAIHCVNHFDDAEKTVSFLFTNGRSGSLLLHSLLDNHEELILMPRLFPYYINYNETNREFFASFYGVDQAIQYLLTYSGFTYDDDSINHHLGENKDESIDLDLTLYGSILRSLTHKLKEYNSRTFLLAIHYAYALYIGQDVQKIRSILLHHHHSVTSYQLPTTQCMQDHALKQLFVDFPNAKFIHTIRHPYAMFMRSMEAYEVQDNFLTCWRRIFLFFLGFYQAHLLEDAIGSDRYKYIRMEDVHRNSEFTLAQICRFIGIGSSSCLTQTTLQGKLWWGLQPNTAPLLGINPNFKDNLSMAKLDANSIQLCQQFLQPMLSKFGYEVPADSLKEYQQGSIWGWTQYEKQAFSQCFPLFLKGNFWEKRAVVKLVLTYPIQRYRLINDILQLSHHYSTQFAQLKSMPFWLKQNKTWFKTLKQPSKKAA